jgi:hypothetical protein
VAGGATSGGTGTDADLASPDYCFLTTTGRRTGSVYLLSGGGERSDWVRNIRAEPRVGLRIGDRDMICRAEVVGDPDEDALARRLLLEKYRPRYRGDLDEWGETALPIAIELPSAT